jgi:hypothetical protein
MANIRNLKKDIDYLVYQVISDCFSAMSVTKEESVSDGLADIVSDAVKLRNGLFSRIKQKKDEEKPEKLKDYYRNLRNDLVKGIDELFERLSKVVGS